MEITTMSQPHRHIRTTEAVQSVARLLRQEMTPAEKALWQRLRDCQVQGCKFRRQHPLGVFVADFYCAARRLVIELDGAVHDNLQERDAARTAELNARGYRVLRFRNDEVMANMEGVLSAIAEALTPSPSPMD
jgi:very-short-patch-repair endonuclease